MKDRSFLSHKFSDESESLSNKSEQNEWGLKQIIFLPYSFNKYSLFKFCYFYWANDCFEDYESLKSCTANWFDNF